MQLQRDGSNRWPRLSTDTLAGSGPSNGERLCAGCRADLSNRHRNTKLCANCSVRAHVESVRACRERKKGNGEKDWELGADRARAGKRRRSTEVSLTLGVTKPPISVAKLFAQRAMAGDNLLMDNKMSRSNVYRASNVRRQNPVVFASRYWDA